VNQRIHAIHKQINEIEVLLRTLRAEVALLSTDLDFSSIPELESVVVEEDG
jgi:hypothetical protein